MIITLRKTDSTQKKRRLQEASFSKCFKALNQFSGCCRRS